MAKQSPWPLHCLVASTGVLREPTRTEIGCVVAGVLCSRSHGLLMGPAASVARDSRRKGSRSKSCRDKSHICCHLQTDHRHIWVWAPSLPCSIPFPLGAHDAGSLLGCLFLQCRLEAAVSVASAAPLGLKIPRAAHRGEIVSGE